MNLNCPVCGKPMLSERPHAHALRRKPKRRRKDIIDSHCPDCGRLIWGDTEGFDDVVSAPFVCSAGDLHCIPCGRRCEAEMERQDEENADDWLDPFEEDLQEIGK